jgi:hypothetical protein
MMNQGLRSFQGGTTLLTEPIPSPEEEEYQQQQQEQQQSSTSAWDTTAKVKENVPAAAAKAKDFVASSKHWISESAQTQFENIKVKTWNEHKPSWRRLEDDGDGGGDDDDNNGGDNDKPGHHHAPFPETLDEAMDEVKESIDARAPDTGAPLGGPPVPDVTERSRL